jgi:serine/threonine-protein kinase
VYTVEDDIYGTNLGEAPTKNVPLIQGSGQKRGPAISPDGRWIAYSSDETGRPEVYVRPFPDTKASRRQLSVAGGISPRWSHNGRELFFVDESLNMVSVAVSPGSAFIVGEPQRLFDATLYSVPILSFDVAPDGRFLMIRPSGAATLRPDEMILVENAFAELSGKAKRN